MSMLPWLFLLMLCLSCLHLHRSVLRRHGWSPRNTPVNVTLPFSRGKRVSILAAMDVTGYFAWRSVEDTFTRAKFHEVFKKEILPFLNPWPLPRSIVVMDNAKIHMYEEFQTMIHATGALLFFLPHTPQISTRLKLVSRC